MEFLPSEIARLVLGYLEDEKCESAYETFLTTSPNLTECLRMREMGKKFRTQVIGLSLIDILHEYSAIYCSVHERLKKVDPETAESLRNSGSLLDKLTFLLNANGSGQTMLFSITLPHGKSPGKSGVAHVRKRFKPATLERKERLRKVRTRTESDIISDDLNESRNNQSDINTTPLCSLPGNSTNLRDELDINHKSDGEEINRTPKRKSAVCTRKARGDTVSEVVEETLDFSVLTKALIDNRELHEKLAENINKVIGTPEVTQAGAGSSQGTHIPQPFEGGDNAGNIKLPDSLSSTNMYSTSFCTELDNAIKKIVQQTESDPVFENILFDVIAPLTEETSDDCEDRGISETSTPRKFNSHANDGSNSSDQETNKTVVAAKSHPLRHAKTKALSETNNTEITTPSKILDDLNADAVKNIIAVTAEHKEEEQLNKTHTESMTYETIICDALKNTQTTTITTVTETICTTVETNVPKINESIPQNSQTPGLILGQSNQNIVVISHVATPAITQPTFVLASARSSFPTIENQLLVLGNKRPLTSQPIIIQSQPQQYPTTVLTERDIMTMPTVIMYGDDRSMSSSTFSMTPQPIYSTIPQVSQPKVPKTSTIAILPKKAEPERSTPQLSITLYASDEKSSQDSDGKMIPVGSVQVMISPVKPGPSVPMIQNESPAKEKPAIAHVTPPKVNVCEKQSMSTPRSGKSHIRALDFSTPAKDDISPREANTSPKPAKRISTLRKIPQNSNIKTSLFQTIKESKEEVEESTDASGKTPVIKLYGEWDNVQGTGLILGNNLKKETCTVNKSVSKKDTWDEDLRAICASDSTLTKNTVSKRIRKTPKRKIKKKPEDLNSTEIDAQKIEAAVSILDTTINTSDEMLTKNEKSAENKIDEKKEKEDGKKSKQKTSKKVVKKKADNDIKDEIVKDEESNKVLNTEKELILVELKCEIDGVIKNEPEKVAVETKTNLRNMRPRVRKKCNLGNSARKVLTSQSELVVTKPEQDTSKSMKVLSPSKLKANKRSLVENDIPKVDHLPAEIPYIEETDLNKITPTTSKVLDEKPITAKANLTPMLETPMKFDSSDLPFTPQIFTPYTDTPYSKILKENLGTVDFSTIPTPNFPITPNFTNLTPNCQTDEKPYNRPTDYSTSSSYYQPSDNEHNPVLDNVLIEESKNMDKKIEKLSEEKKINKQKLLNTPDNNEVSEGLVGKKISCALNEVSPDLHKIDENKTIDTSIDQTIIKPGTSAVKENESDTSSAESSDETDVNSSTSSSASSSSEEENSRDSSLNTTVIKAAANEEHDSSNRRYSLRSRPTPSKSFNKTQISKDIKKTTPLKINLSKKKVYKKPAEDKLKNNERIEVDQEDKQTDVQDKTISDEKPKPTIQIKKNEGPPNLNQPSTSVGTRIARPKSKSAVGNSLFEDLAEKRRRVAKAIKDETSKQALPKKVVAVRRQRSKIVAPKIPSKPVIKSQMTKNLDETKETTKTDQKMEIELNVKDEESKVENKNDDKTVSVEIKHINKTEENIVDKKSSKDTVVEVKKPKSKPLRKSASIEAVAARLKSQEFKESPVKKSEAVNKPSDLSITKECSVKITSLENYAITKDIETIDKETENKAHNEIRSKTKKTDEPEPKTHTIDKKEHAMIRRSIDSDVDTTKMFNNPIKLMKEEIIMHLHISSDEEEMPDMEDTIPDKISINVQERPNQNSETKKLEELKERGIYLVPKNKAENEDASESRKVSSLDHKVFVQNIVVLNKEEKIDFSKMETQACVKTDIICKPIKKVQESVDVTKQVEAKTIDIKNQPVYNSEQVINDSLNKELSVIEEQISIEEATEEFEILDIAEESPTFFKFTYNEATPCIRKLEDYNIEEFAIKEINANVYSAKYEVEVDIAMHITPFIELYSFPSEVKSNRQENIPKKRIAKLTTIKRSLEKIDKSDTGDSKTKTSITGETESEVDEKTKTEKKSKINDESNKTKEKPTPKKQKLDKKEDQSKGKATISLEQYKNRQAEQKITDEGNNNDNKIRDDEDELMDLVITSCSNQDQGQEVNTKKRKLISDNESPKQNPEKRSKQGDRRALLKNVDLDQFLTQVHGPSEDENVEH